MERLRKIRNGEYQFSFVESLTREGRDPYRDQHFQQVLTDLRQLESWMGKNQMENNWTLQEKLAFLRNVEATIRTGTAVRRTQLAWFTLAIGTIAALLGFLIGINA